jgi:glycosyltransferase involved in cell wall biosynthesis
VSPVGMNTEVVQDDYNGYICRTPADWHLRLRQLLTDAAHRQALGLAARATIEQRYSVNANTPNFLALFS